MVVKFEKTKARPRHRQILWTGKRFRRDATRVSRERVVSVYAAGKGTKGRNKEGGRKAVCTLTRPLRGSPPCASGYLAGTKVQVQP